MTSNPASPNSPEDNSPSIEDDPNTMDEQKFLKQWKYSLHSDFTSESGAPATWAPSHPKHWGEEDAKISLDGEATTPTISHDDKFVVVGIRNEIHVFNLAAHVRTEVLRGHPGKVEAVIFAPCFDQGSDPDIAQYLLASQSEQEGGVDAVVTLWVLDENGEQVQSVDGDTSPSSLQFPGKLGSFGSPVFSTDGKNMVYLVSNVSVHPNGLSKYAPFAIIWDIQSRSIRHQLRGHTDFVMWIGISPDNLLTASISWDGTTRIWDTYSGKCLHVIGPLGGQLWCGVFSPDSKLLAISQGHPKSVSIYDIANEPLRLQLISRVEIPT